MWKNVLTSETQLMIGFTIKHGLSDGVFTQNGLCVGRLIWFTDSNTNSHTLAALWMIPRIQCFLCCTYHISMGTNNVELTDISLLTLPFF